LGNIQADEAAKNRYEKVPFWDKLCIKKGEKMGCNKCSEKFVLSEAESKIFFVSEHEELVRKSRIFIMSLGYDVHKLHDLNYIVVENPKVFSSPTSMRSKGILTPLNLPTSNSISWESTTGLTTKRFWGQNRCSDISTS
jgi:hypothetical protein